MKKIFSKRNKRFLCLFLSFLILFYTTACNYYKVNTTGPESLAKVSRVQKSFIIHNQADAGTFAQEFWMTGLSVSAQGLSGHLSTIVIDTVNQAVDYNLFSPVYEKVPVARPDPLYYKGRKNRYSAKEKPILHEVHIYVDRPAMVTGSTVIPLKDIREVHIIEADSGKTVASYFFGIIGVIAIIFAILLIIVALTKSSCPYVYTYDGEAYLFQGEIYGGAIQRNLERPDFMPLPLLQPVEGEYRLRLSNELKERQYTNLAELVVVNHPAGSKVLLDRRGGPQLFSDPIPPLEAFSEGGRDLSAVLSATDHSAFLFDDVETENKVLHLSFAKPENTHTARLLLNAKNTLWVDYLFGEFTKEFGFFYPTWIERQSRAPAEASRQLVIDQDFPLSIYLNTDNGWELVEHLPTVGPMAARDFAIPIDLSKVSGDRVELRLQTGFLFWEMDYAAMDFTDPQALDIRRIAATLAVDQDGVDHRAELGVDDDRYFAQPEPGMIAELRYAAIPVPEGQAQSVFLHTKGYYEHVRDYSGAPNFFRLRKFNEPGHFSDYSQAEYLRLLEGREDLLVAR